VFEIQYGQSIRWRPPHDRTRMLLTELKVFSETLPKCGELTGSRHSDELTA